MRGKLTTGTCIGTQPQGEKLQRAMVNERRSYNRRYMRVWRSDPRRAARERVNRQKWYHERKLRDARQEWRPYTNDLGQPVCGFCLKNPPIREVVRLRIPEFSNGAYVEVRIPYCGQC